MHKLLLSPEGLQLLRKTLASLPAAPKVVGMYGCKSLMLGALSRLMELPVSHLQGAFHQPGLYVLDVGAASGRAGSVFALVLWLEGGDMMDLSEATTCSLVRYVAELAADVVVCLEDGAAGKVAASVSTSLPKVNRLHRLHVVMEQVTKDDVAISDWGTMEVDMGTASRCVLAAGGSNHIGAAFATNLKPTTMKVERTVQWSMAEVEQSLCSLQAQYKLSLPKLSWPHLERLLKCAPSLWSLVVQQQEKHSAAISAASQPVDLAEEEQRVRACIEAAVLAVMTDVNTASAAGGHVPGKPVMGGGGEAVEDAMDCVVAEDCAVRRLERVLVQLYGGMGGQGEYAHSACAPQIVFYGQEVSCWKCGEAGVVEWLNVAGALWNLVPWNKGLKLEQGEKGWECDSGGQQDSGPTFFLMPDKAPLEGSPVCFNDRVLLKFRKGSIRAVIVSSVGPVATGVVLCSDVVTFMHVKEEREVSLHAAGLVLQHAAGQGCSRGLHDFIAAVVVRESSSLCHNRSRTTMGGCHEGGTDLRAVLPSRVVSELYAQLLVARALARRKVELVREQASLRDSSKEHATARD